MYCLLYLVHLSREGKFTAVYTSRQDCSVFDRARENAIYKVMETNERN